MQEDCAIDGDLVQVPGDLKTGANVRRRGEDLRAGDLLLPAGTRLGPQHLGLAASVGVADLTVKRRLRVAFVASGDELVMPGRPLAPGQIYNSNRFLFSALLEALGCTVIHLGIVEDRLEATVEALAAAADQADLVLASGGVSVGDEDHVRPAVERLGSLDLWRVAMRPGKPLAFGHIGDTPFIGSPGNPVSLFVTFCLFARPFILRMQGVAGDLRPLHLPVRAGFDWPTPTKRREYLRARLDQDADGAPVAQIFSSRSSAALTSLTWADGLVVMPQGRTLTTGETISFIPFSELLD
jgi:molybdopterin molybdotransferase